MRLKRMILVLAGALGCEAVFEPATPASAAEGGHGVYLLGLKSANAGITPPPGVYFANNVYYYAGAANASQPFPLVGGTTVAGINANVWLDLPSVLWSTPIEIFGGNLAFSALMPLGGPSVNAGATLTSPLVGSPVSGTRNDSVKSYGDPAISALIGWHSGNFHWNAGVTGFFPVGDYREGALANIANHRLAVDFNGAVTWLDPRIGLDLSAALGFTVSQENTATDYRTGDEFHLEWAATQNLSKEFSIGLVGYYYNQLTGDSGTGATLGRFKGEVTAVGGSIGFNFKLGNLPVSTRLRAYHEFNVRNRLEGNAGYFTLSAPLYVQASAPR